MRKLVLTISEGLTYKKISEVTHETLQNYAHKCGADFLSWKAGVGHRSSPHFAKFNAIYRSLDSYDRVLYIDSDIVIADDAPNLFDIVPEDALGILEEGTVQPRDGLLQHFCKTYNLPLPKKTERYYNTGVMLVSELQRDVFSPWSSTIVRVDNFFEQTFINYRIASTHPKFKVFELDPKFNWMSCFWKADKPRASGHFIHYAGMSNTMPLPELLQVMQEDRDFVDKHYTKPKRKFALKIDGGLGDQVAANPTVRYLVEGLYKDEDIVIVSHFPEIWKQHDVPVFIPGKDLIEDASERTTIWSLPSTDHPIWNVMSHALVNAYDYAAIAMTRGELPYGAKRIKFHESFSKRSQGVEAWEEISRKAGLGSTLRDWSRVVLVHAGRGWASKTFPPDVWESYVDTIVKMKWQPVLIGKNTGDQGTVDFKYDKEKVINLVDKLSLSELIQIIRMSPALLSNDSSPVHIAGAFDNHIGLIATCKRPEYILPYRHIYDLRVVNEYSIWSRVQNLESGYEPLYEKFSRDPTLTGNVVMHECEESELRKGLPDPGVIADWLDDVERDLPLGFTTYSNQ